MIETITKFLPEILLTVFGTMAFLQIIIYVTLFFRFAFHKQKPLESMNPPVSVVITAKNEAHNLIETLPHFLTQEYPKFEVVIVNDNSNDETLQVVLDFQKQFPNLKIVNLESSVTNIKGKKFPLSLGIKAANYEHVLLTDADCLPVSNQWIKLMARHFHKTKHVVLGYSNIRKKASFFNTLIRFDKLHEAIQYFSCCLAKMPYMGVGQNLAYTKTTFFNNKGFASQNHLQFGDDDLFINKVATKWNCDIEYEKDAHIISRPYAGFRNWFWTKTFRRKTRSLYTKCNRCLLNLYTFLMTFSYIALAFAIVFTLANPLYLTIVLSILVIKYTLQYVCFGFAAAKLNEKKLIPYILFFDIIFSALNPVVYIASKFKD